MMLNDNFRKIIDLTLLIGLVDDQVDIKAYINFNSIINGTTGTSFGSFYVDSW